MKTLQETQEEFRKMDCQAEPTKLFRISPKELKRADNGYTPIVRLQKKTGLYLVCVMNIETQKPVFKFNYVEKSEICKAIADDLRMMDKCGFAVPMADASRHRAGIKWEKARRV